MSTGLLEAIRENLGKGIADAVAILPGRVKGVTTHGSDGFGLGLGRLTVTSVDDSGAETNTSFPVQDAQIQMGSLSFNTSLTEIANGWGAAPERVDRIPEKPSTSMLKAMAAPELALNARQEFALQVEDLLGYTPLRKDAGAPSKLRRLLAELEIEAFDQATVDEYKRGMQAHFQALAKQKDEAANDEVLNRINTSADPWGTFQAVASLRLQSTRVTWKPVRLEEYSKPVPTFVLNKCMQIKQRAPDAVFLVDELCENTRMIDPFLVVELGGDRAAIEVWDEPEFEKTL